MIYLLVKSGQFLFEQSGVQGIVIAADRNVYSVTKRDASTSDTGFLQI